MDRPKRIAWPRAGTCSLRPSHRSSPSVMASGVSESDTSVATRSPTARPSGLCGPTSATVPTSMPPDPVTGFCILPRVATMSSTSARTASPSPCVLLGQLAVGRRVEVERLDVDPHLVRPDLRPRRRAGWPPAGARPAGSRTRCSPSGDEVEGATQILLSRWSLTAGSAVHGCITRTFSSYPSIMTAAMTLPEQPYAYRQRELVEPDWTRLPGLGPTSPPAEWADVQWQRAHCVKNVRQLHDVMGDLLTEDLLRRPRARPGRARDDVDARSRRRCSTPWCRPWTATMPTAGAAYTAGVLRRPGPALHAPGLLRPPHRLAVAPARDARQPPRARHVGGRGADPPLPHQGARRAAADLPAVLRPLHPDGPRRQLHAAGRQAQAGRQAGRPVCGDARLPVHDAAGPRRRRVRWRRGQHAVEEPRGVPRPAARARQHPRHPAGHQGPDGPAAALAGARRRRGRGPGRDQGARARCVAGHPHARQLAPSR